MPFAFRLRGLAMQDKVDTLVAVPPSAALSYDKDFYA